MNSSFQCSCTDSVCRNLQNNSHSNASHLAMVAAKLHRKKKAHATADAASASQTRETPNHSEIGISSYELHCRANCVSAARDRRYVLDLCNGFFSLFNNSPLQTVIRVAVFCLARYAWLDPFLQLDPFFVCGGLTRFECVQTIPANSSNTWLNRFVGRSSSSALNSWVIYD